MERRRRIQRTQRPRRVAAASSAAHRRCMAERQLGRPCRLPNSVTSRDASTCGFVGVVIEMADGWRPPPSRSRSSTGPFPPCAGGITMSTALSYLAARSEPKVLPARRVWQDPIAEILGCLLPSSRRFGQTWCCRAAVEVDEEVVASGRVHPKPGRCPRQPRGGASAGLLLALNRHRVLEVDDEPVGTGGRGFVEALRGLCSAGGTGAPRRPTGGNSRVNESSDTSDKPVKPQDYAGLRAELAELVDDFFRYR